MSEESTVTFKCDLCESQFKFRHSLTVHKRRKHGEVKSNACKRDVKYTSLRSLKSRAVLKHCAPNPEELYKCDKCNFSSSYMRNLNRHKISKHGAQKVKKQYQCELCPTQFKYLNNLKTHERKKHGKNNGRKVDKTIPCTKCGRMFWRKRSLREHERLKHDEKIAPATASCPMCSHKASKNELCKHYEEAHGITVVTNIENFNSLSEFNDWKLTKEKETKSKYITESGCKMTKNQVKNYRFHCHRSGTFVAKGKNQRQLKAQGSKKINGFCPASMRVLEFPNGTCEVHFTETHVGHENDLKHLFLTSDEREEIAKLIATKKPFEIILDDIRKRATGSPSERLHLLTRKDIYNIEATFNLSAEKGHHGNDLESVACFVNQCREQCILFYKNQGIDYDHNTLKASDFVLIIMSPAQAEFLKKYGKKQITVAVTHRMSGYDFQLITLMTLDDLNHACPAAFLISNRTDEPVLTLFFTAVRERIGPLQCDIFMSDMEEEFYKAWEKTMGTPNKRLFCTWNVDNAWRRNIKTRIKNTMKQIETYKCLRVLFLEKDEEVFETMLNNFTDSLFEDPERNDFASYFAHHYKDKAKYWAFCYRKECGINTNIHIERMYRTLKHIYLKGKKNKRLDKALHAIMMLTHDRSFHRLSVDNEGKLSSKLTMIRDRHKSALELSLDCVIESEGKFMVPSSDSGETYDICKVKEQCHCRLLCKDCNVCLHYYSCTCIDSDILGNMCKHIHLVNLYLIRKGLQQPVNNENEVSFVSETSAHDGFEVIVNDLNEDNDAAAILTNLLEEREVLEERNCVLEEREPLLEEKEKIIKQFSEILSCASSLDEIKIINRVVSTIKSNICVHREQNDAFLPVSNTCLQNSFELANKNNASQHSEVKSTERRAGKRRNMMSSTGQKKALEAPSLQNSVSEPANENSVSLHSHVITPKRTEKRRCKMSNPSRKETDEISLCLLSKHQLLNNK